MFATYLPLLMPSLRPIECKQGTIIQRITGHFYILTTINRINSVIIGCLIFLRTFDPAFCANFWTVLLFPKFCIIFHFFWYIKILQCPFNYIQILKNAIKFHVIKIRWRLCFVPEGFFKKNSFEFLFFHAGCIGSYLVF